VRAQCGIGPPDSGKTASPAAIPCVLRHYLRSETFGPAALPVQLKFADWLEQQDLTQVEVAQLRVAFPGQLA